MYDSDLGRFFGVDPIAERFPHVNGYNYAENEPVGSIDLHGLQRWKVNNGIINGPYRNSTQANRAAMRQQAFTNILVNSDHRKQASIIPLSDANRGNLSRASIGETLGVYPTKNTTNPSWSEISNPENWDIEKTNELLEARAAIDFIAENRNPLTGDAGLGDASDEIGAYHLRSNFPDVAPEIKNDASVTAFYLSSSSDAKHTGIKDTYWNQSAVKTYGPFYNIGGGDVKRGEVYIIFYSVTPK